MVKLATFSVATCRGWVAGVALVCGLTCASATAVSSNDAATPDAALQAAPAPPADGSQTRPHADGPSDGSTGLPSQRATGQAKALFWRVTAVQIAGGAVAVLGCVMLVLGWPLRREGPEWVLGWLMLGWAALSVRLWLRNTPLDNPTAAIMVGAAQAGLTGLAVIFLLRCARWTFRPLRIALLAQCVLMPMSFLLAGPHRLPLMSGIWALLLGAEVLAAMALFLALAWAQRRADFWAMAPVLGGVALLLMMQVAFQLRLHDPPAIDVTPLGLSLAFMALATRVLLQFSAQGHRHRQAQEARRSLETRLHDLAAAHQGVLNELTALRVESQRARARRRTTPAMVEASSETERSLAHQAEVNVEQATAQERKRIAADLHDDLGAKLLTIVHTSESDHISALAREALEEMRLSVRGLSGKPMRLADALADWRAETVARLSQANIEIDWRGLTEETEQRLAARSFVQTTRILREAISNIIKHSGASQCKVRCGIREGEFGLVVQDNGNGISMELDGKLDRGHGMASMKNRAKQMQGQCLVESGPGYGTVIRLTLPL